MPATESGSFLNRISLRRNQVVAVDCNNDQEIEDLELYQKHVSDRFSELLPPSLDSSTDAACSLAAAGDVLFSIAWLRRLLDVFLCCEAEFKAVLIIGRDPSTFVSKPLLDRLLPELLDRSVKALDICNAVTHGIESLRHCQKMAEIAVTALEQKPLGEGHVKRARKALNSLIIAMTIDDKEGNHHKATERSWSFGRRSGGGNAPKDRLIDPFRSLSWHVSKTWSAAKQLEAMSSNLAPPRSAESTGLALPVYMMSSVLFFIMWIMVAAIPCQERTGLNTHFPIPKQLNWAHSMWVLQEKVAEEWKKKEKKGTAGLMDEMLSLEKLAKWLMDFADSFQFPAEEERMEELGSQVEDLAETCRKLDEGLAPLQHQIREVFHRIVRSRTEILDVMDQAGKAVAPSN